MASCFLYADVGSAGLGNRLFPWARCEVQAKRTGQQVLAPAWVRPKIGPLLRGERDLRFYCRLFTSSDYVTGLKKALALMFAWRVGEEHASDAKRTPSVGAKLIVFRGLGGYFEPLMKDREYLYARFLQMTNPEILAQVERLSPRGRVIMVHIRRGDFGAAVPFGTLSSAPYYSLCNQWYINCLQAIRKHKGPLPIWIVSDAADEDIDSIRSVGDVRFVRGGNALVDLLLLSRADVLVLSPGSTFSAWAGFFGKMDVVTVPTSLVTPFVRHGQKVVWADGFGSIA